MTFTKGCIPIKKELERRQKISRTMSGTRPNNFNLFKERCLEYMKINHGNSKTFKEGPSHPNFQENPSYRAIHAWARERMPKEKKKGPTGVFVIDHLIKEDILKEEESSKLAYMISSHDEEMRILKKCSLMRPRESHCTLNQ